MSDDQDARGFYTGRIPAQFNRALDELAGGGEASAHAYDGVRAVNATMKIVVEGEAGGTFYLNILAGRMTAGDEPAHSPFLTLMHDLAAFEVLRREAGDSALGFLGGLAGLAGEIHLTQQRLDNLAGMSGSLRFALEGEGGFALLTHFGADPVPAEPSCSIVVDAAAYEDLRSGKLNPQDAFMSGQINVQGDMQMAMQLALAVLAPD